MLLWFSYSWCLIWLQFHVELLNVFRFLSVLMLLVRQTARCSPTLKTRKLQLLMNTTLLLLCCRVSWVNNLQHKLTWQLSCNPVKSAEVSLIWIGGVVYVHVRIFYGRFCSSQISTSVFLASRTISPGGEVLLLTSLAYKHDLNESFYADLQCVQFWGIVVNLWELFTRIPAKGLNSGTSLEMM